MHFSTPPPSSVFSYTSLHITKLTKLYLNLIINFDHFRKYLIVIINNTFLSQNMKLMLANFYARFLKFSNAIIFFLLHRPNFTDPQKKFGPGANTSFAASSRFLCPKLSNIVCWIRWWLQYELMNLGHIGSKMGDGQNLREAQGASNCINWINMNIWLFRDEKYIMCIIQWEEEGRGYYTGNVAEINEETIMVSFMTKWAQLI